MSKQNDADADDDAAAAADISRVEVVVTSLIVDQGPRVRSSHTAPWGAGLLGVVVSLAKRISAGFESQAFHHLEESRFAMS